MNVITVYTYVPSLGYQLQSHILVLRLSYWPLSQPDWLQTDTRRWILVYPNRKCLAYTTLSLVVHRLVDSMYRHQLWLENNCNGATVAFYHRRHDGLSSHTVLATVGSVHNKLTSPDHCTGTRVLGSLALGCTELHWHGDVRSGERPVCECHYYYYFYYLNRPYGLVPATKCGHLPPLPHRETLAHPPSQIRAGPGS